MHQEVQKSAPPGSAFLIGYGFVRTQPALMDSVGQTAAQAPQSMQVSASMLYWVSPAEIAEVGHSPSQAPQLMQLSLMM